MYPLMHSNFIRKGEKPPLCRPCGSSSVFRFFEDDDEVKTTPSKTPAIVVAWLSYADGKNLLIHKKKPGAHGNPLLVPDLQVP